MAVSDNDNGISMPDSVVFDIGNVLLEWDRRLLYRQIFASEEEVERFLAEVCPMDWHLEFDRGRSFADGIAERIALFPHYEAELLAYDSRWNDTIPGAIEGTVAILGELKAAGVPLYAITNFNRDKFDDAMERFPFLATSFIDTVVSGDERLIKPDPRIYQILFARNDLHPGRTVFIDDTMKNVEAARGVGMHALHFSSPDRLRRDLVDFGFPLK
ncbi:HAD family phosphatase [Stappia sp. F7233]|uniref:HAD family phosphatase n=1 Tax=Stappia albiluteola TaxID=2758565 RepID=A0A839ABB7_9HYPH|nr:HAD family phosphatase [Stappia albiluteola]MBA5776242.1 HAD family phosphatase [Stappia albiluteola]